MTSATATALTAAPPAADVAPAAPAAQQTTPAATSIDWLPGADEATVGYIQNKNWSNPMDLVNAYRGAEKFVSAPIAQRLVMPGADAPQAEKDAFYNRLGRPADAAGYGIKAPDGYANPEIFQAAGTKFHELGLTKAQGENLMGWWHEQNTAQSTAMEAQRTEAFNNDEAQLRAEWGAAYAQNLAHAQNAARGLGFDGPTIDKFQSVLGHKGTMALLQKIGSKIGESDLATGEGVQKFDTAMTPAQAKDRIKSNMADKNFSGRYFNGDAQARAEMDRLHKFAFPEAQP